MYRASAGKLRETRIERAEIATMAEVDGAVTGGHRHGPAPRRSAFSSESWGHAILTSAIVLVLAIVGFGIVPDRLITFLTTRITPTWRDLLVTLWVVGFFVFLTWLYVRLQPRAGGA
jgi:hypothetical protein